MKSTLRILFVLLPLVLNAMVLRADDTRMAELKAKIKEVEKKAEQDPAVLEAKAALKQTTDKLNEFRRSASDKLNLTDEIQATKKEADALSGDAKAPVVKKLKGLEAQVDQDPEVQAAMSAYREAKNKSRTILRETMERLDAGVSGMITEVGNLEKAKRASKAAP
jgi:chromosome segregation ATPase